MIGLYVTVGILIGTAIGTWIALEQRYRRDRKRELERRFHDVLNREI